MWDLQGVAIYLLTLAMILLPPFPLYYLISHSLHLPSTCILIMPPIYPPLLARSRHTTWSYSRSCPTILGEVGGSHTAHSKSTSYPSFSHRTRKCKYESKHCVWLSSETAWSIEAQPCTKDKPTNRDLEWTRASNTPSDFGMMVAVLDPANCGWVSTLGYKS